MSSHPTRLEPFTTPPDMPPGGIRRIAPAVKSILPQSTASPQKSPSPPIHRTISDNSGDGYVKFFRHYGLSLYIDNQQLKGACPFPDCRKEDHFFGSYGTGKWDCKRCGRTGNAYTFISQFHEAALGLTTDQDYIALAQLRSGIPEWVFKEWKLALNPLTNEWMLPAWSLEKKMTNLYIWRQLYDTNKQSHFMTIMSGPTLKQILYGLQKFRNTKERPLYLLEGHWDGLAFDGLCAYTIDTRTGQQLSEAVDFLAVPGAGGFPKEYLHLLDNRDVRVLYDNDKAGRDGVDKLVKAIAQNNTLPKRFGVLEWPGGLKEGFDVRDLIALGV